jgi:hypothetical protein
LGPFEFRENRYSEDRTFPVGVNELHLYVYAETVWHSVSKERLAGEVYKVRAYRTYNLIKYSLEFEGKAIIQCTGMN